MALQINYNGNEAYLKAVPTTINEEIVDNIKKITTYVIYSISVGGDFVEPSKFLMMF